MLKYVFLCACTSRVLLSLLADHNNHKLKDHNYFSKQHTINFVQITDLQELLATFKFLGSPPYTLVPANWIVKPSTFKDQVTSTSMTKWFSYPISIKGCSQMMVTLFKQLHKISSVCLVGIRMVTYMETINKA